MQRERRHDPYPWTWEPAALVGLLVVLGLVLGVQLGRSLANLIAGAGWTWPAAASGASSGPDVPSPVGAAFWRSLLGVLSGDAGAGLAEPAPHGLAGPGLVWTSVAATEAAILSVLVWAGVQAYLRWGPSRLRGMRRPRRFSESPGSGRSPASCAPTCTASTRGAPPTSAPQFIGAPETSLGRPRHRAPARLMPTSSSAAA